MKLDRPIVAITLPSFNFTLVSVVTGGY